MAIFFTAYRMNMCGNVAVAQRRIAQLRATMAGDPVAVGLDGLAECLVGVGEPDRLRQLAVESAMLLEDAGHPLAWGARMRLGAAMHAVGEAEAGVAVIRGVLAGMEHAGNLFDQPVPMLQLGISLTDLGRIDEARPVYRRMIALCQRHGFDHALFRAYMGFAEAAMRDPSPYMARVGALVCGAAQAMSVRSGLPQVSWWESRLQAARIAAVTMLGEDPVAVLIAEGRAIPPPGAARLALGR